MKATAIQGPPDPVEVTAHIAKLPWQQDSLFPSRSTALPAVAAEEPVFGDDHPFVVPTSCLEAVDTGSSVKVRLTAGAVNVVVRPC